MTARRLPNDHAAFRLLAAAAVDGWINPAEAADLEAHLATCPACRADQQAMLADHDWLASPARAVSPDSRVRAAVLDAARSPRIPRIGDVARPWAALAAAAVIVALIGGGVLLTRFEGWGVGAIATPTAGQSPTAAASPTPVPLGTLPTSGPCVPLPANLSAWWPGGDERDLVGGRDLQLRGSAAYSPGLIGGALSLDGVTGYAEVPYDLSLGFGKKDFTIMLWVRFASVAGEQVLIEQWQDTGGGAPESAGWTLTKLGDQVILFTSENQGPAVGGSTPALDLQPGVWYHVAVRRMGPDISIIVDGMTIGAGSGVPDADIGLEAPLLLGRRGDFRGYLLKGQLDEVQIVVGRALFETDIKAAYLAGSTGSCPS